MVFVTERDNLSGSFASEGVLGGDVADPPPADPEITPKPAFDVVRAAADCYAQLGRDCPGPPAVASPTVAALPPAQPGEASSRSVTVTNPGSVPVALGAAWVSGPSDAGLSVASNPCAGMVLEPRETCAVSARFAPAAIGNAEGTLELSSDDGTVEVPLAASAPSVSGLLSPDLRHPRFVPVAGADGVGYRQRWRLALTSPFGAAVSIAHATLSGADARRFRITSDGCAHATLRPYGGCRLSVTFTPSRPGTGRAQLNLSGTGLALTARLQPVAFALPAVRSLSVVNGSGCSTSPGAPVSATISQAATVHWTLHRSPATRPGACPRIAATGAPAVASGWLRTKPRHPGYAARWSLPGGAHLAPGPYVLDVSVNNAHGTGAVRSLALRLQP
jgi:hypothetical protein